jgi:hypothetical protein
MLSLIALLTHAAQADQLLFVGNSYTFYNDLNLTLAYLIETRGGGVLAARLVGGGMTFDQHYTNAQDKGTPWHAALVGPEQIWDWVILQEQSQIPGFPESSSYITESVAAAQGLDGLIAAKDAETVFMMTWGRRSGDSQNADRYPDFSTMQGHLTDGYLRYQAETSTADRPTWIAPVGLAFAHIHDSILEDGADPLSEESTFWTLYSNDGSHPSPRGSYLAACVIYVTLTGESSIGLPSQGSMSDSEREFLQTAADASVFGSLDLLDYPWEDDSTPDDTASPKDTGEDRDDDTAEDRDDDTDGDTGTDADADADADAGGSGCGGGRAGLLAGLLAALGWRRRR